MESTIQIVKLSLQLWEPEAYLFKCVIWDSHHKSRILDLKENMKYCQVYDKITRAGSAA